VGEAVGDIGAPWGGVHGLRGLRGVGAGAGVAFPERAFAGGVQQRQVVVGFRPPPCGERAAVLRRTGTFVGLRIGPPKVLVTRTAWVPCLTASASIQSMARQAASFQSRWTSSSGTQAAR